MPTKKEKLTLRVEVRHLRAKLSATSRMYNDAVKEQDRQAESYMSKIRELQKNLDAAHSEVERLNTIVDETASAKLYKDTYADGLSDALRIVSRR